MNEPWYSLGDWWLEELASDPAYHNEIAPLLIELLSPGKGSRYLDVGCGEGRLLESLGQRGSEMVGCDLNPQLLALAKLHGPVVRSRIPHFDWIREGAFDGALVSLVLEHVERYVHFFASLARAVRPGGILALAINHPVWTAPGSSPIEDGTGETLWRPGSYFGTGHSDEPAGDRTVRFYHRTMAELLTSAADSGWDLERLVERGVSHAQVERFPDYAGQDHIPRLLGVRWRRR